MSTSTTPRSEHISRRGEARQARARYLTQSMLLEEFGVPGVVRLGVLATALLLTGAIAWASVTPVDELVRTRGQVLPAGREHVIQHLEGGRIEEILVDNGSRVRRGDALLRLSRDQVASELEQWRLRHTRLALEVERLEALDAQRSPDFSLIGAGMPEIVQHQRQLFDAERASFASRIIVAEGKIEQQERTVLRHRQRAMAIERQLSLLEERHQMQVQLRGRGGVSRNEVLALGAQVAEVRSDHEEARGNVLVGESALQQTRHELLEMRLAERARIRTALADVTSRLSDAAQNLLRAQRRLSQLEVRSPVDGIVKGLRVNTINQVVKPGEVMMTLVPVGDRMVVESRMSAQDVGFVRPGTLAHVAVDSFDVSRYGTVAGRVDRISASTFAEGEAEPFYKVQLDLDRDHVGADRERGRLLPGMTVEASIVTGTKTVLDYLLKPVYRGLRESFHER